MKLKEKNIFLKKSNGITLIALVVTIIVLIILAGISINLILGDNGIITKAQEAKAANLVAAIQEKIQLWKTEHEMSKYTGTEVKDLSTFLEELVAEGLLTEDQADDVLASENKELIIGDKKLSFLVEVQETTVGHVPVIESLTYTRSENSLNLNTVAYEKKPLEDEHIGELTKAEGAPYGFVAGEDGTIVSENVDNVSENIFADSYIKIDLTNVKENVVVKIKVTSSSLAGGIICTTDSTKNIMEDVEAEINAQIFGSSRQEIKINLEAGTEKYIHFAYIYAGKYVENGITDTFTINSIEINKQITDTELTYKYTIEGEEKDSSSSSTSSITIDSTKLVGQEAVEGVSPEIPEGFRHLQGTITEGYVISDLDQNYTVQVEVKNASGEIATKVIEIRGNEFVWIPVELAEGETFEEKYPRTEFEGNEATGSIKPYYTEPYTSGYDGEEEEYEAMLASVNLNKGFYVGRYETGFIGNTAKTKYTSYTSDPTQEQIEEETAKLVVQKDAQIYTWVPWGSAMNDITAYNVGTEERPAYVIGAVQLAQNFAEVNNYSGVTSTLIYGIQWDMVMRYVADTNHNVNDSSSWGNYSDYSSTTGDTSTETGILQTAGKNQAWQARNIYDLAGNAAEWTMECTSTSGIYDRISRSGAFAEFGSGAPVSHRNNGSVTHEGGVHSGFRLALYL